MAATPPRGRGVLRPSRPAASVAGPPSTALSAMGCPAAVSIFLNRFRGTLQRFSKGVAVSALTGDARSHVSGDFAAATATSGAFGPSSAGKTGQSGPDRRRGGPIRWGWRGAGRRIGEGAAPACADYAFSMPFAAVSAAFRGLHATARRDNRGYLA